MPAKPADNPPITIRELAALSGYSRTSVSLAMRNHPSLPPATRKHIQSLARQHNYNPDTLVSTLMSRIRLSRQQRTLDKLALLTFWDSAEGWRDCYNDNHYYQGICQRAAQVGYETEHFWTRAPGLTLERLSKILHTRAIRGVLLLPFPSAELAERGMPGFNWGKFATLAIAAPMAGVNSITHDHFNGMRTVIHELRRRRYRRPGLAILGGQGGIGLCWLAAYLAEQRGHEPLEPHLPNRWDCDQFHHWLDREQPDVIISNTETPLEYLRRKKIRVPQQIAYASLDLTNTHPDHSGLNQHPEQIGRAAVDYLVSQLHHNKYGLPEYPEYLEIEGAWQDGQTVAASR